MLKLAPPLVYIARRNIALAKNSWNGVRQSYTFFTTTPLLREFSPAVRRGGKRYRPQGQDRSRDGRHDQGRRGRVSADGVQRPGTGEREETGRDQPLVWRVGQSIL